MVSVFQGKALSGKIRELLIPDRTEADQKEAAVLFNIENGFLKIQGDLTNLFGSKYYNSVVAKVDDYFRKNNRLYVIFNLDYVNLSSAKVVFDLFDRLRIYSGRSEINIDWIAASSDSKMMEIGRYFEEYSELRFNYRRI